jgi:hypothetical protein
MSIAGISASTLARCVLVYLSTADSRTQPGRVNPQEAARFASPRTRLTAVSRDRDPPPNRDMLPSVYQSGSAPESYSWDTG